MSILSKDNTSEYFTSLKILSILSLSNQSKKKTHPTSGRLTKNQTSSIFLCIHGIWDRTLVEPCKIWEICKFLQQFFGGVLKR